MKRFFSAFLVLLIIQAALLSCAGGGLTYPDTTTAALTEKEPGLPAPVPIKTYANAGADALNAAYQSEAHRNSASEGMLFSNGINFVFLYLFNGDLDGAQLAYLNKLSGTAELTPLCSDPLCDHKKDSGCVFYGALMLMYYEGRVFCYKGDPRAYNAAYGYYDASAIFSVDPQGGSYKEHTTFLGETYTGCCQGYNGRLYFLSPGEDYEKNGIVSIDAATGKAEALDFGAQDNIYSFFIADDTIYASQSENGLCAYNLDGTLKEKLSGERFAVSYKYGDWLYSADSRLSLADHTVELLANKAKSFCGDHYWSYGFDGTAKVYRISLADPEAKAEALSCPLPENTIRIHSIEEIDGLLYIAYFVPANNLAGRALNFSLYDPEPSELYTLYNGN